MRREERAAGCTSRHKGMRSKASRSMTCVTRAHMLVCHRKRHTLALVSLHIYARPRHEQQGRPGPRSFGWGPWTGKQAVGAGSGGWDTRRRTAHCTGRQAGGAKGTPWHCWHAQHWPPPFRISRRAVGLSHRVPAVSCRGIYICRLLPAALPSSSRIRGIESVVGLVTPRGCPWQHGMQAAADWHPPTARP